MIGKVFSYVHNIFFYLKPNMRSINRENVFVLRLNDGELFNNR